MGCHIYYYKKTNIEIDFEDFRKKVIEYLIDFYSNQEFTDVKSCNNDTLLRWYAEDILNKDGLILVDNIIYQQIGCPWLRVPPHFYGKVYKSKKGITQFINYLLNETYYKPSEITSYYCAYKYKEKELRWIKNMFIEGETLIECN